MNKQTKYSRKVKKDATKQPEGGFTQIPNSILRNAKLSDGAVRLYAVLRSYGWQDGFCFPGQEKLAADMGVDVRTVRRRSKELQDAQLISVRHRPLHEGVNTTNVYTFTAPDSQVSDPDRTAVSHPDQSPVTDKEYAVDKDSVSPLSPLKGAEEEKNEPTGRDDVASSARTAQPPPPKEEQRGGAVKERPRRRRSRSGGRTPDAAIEALRDSTHGKYGYPDLEKATKIAERFDFTSDDEPPRQIMKELKYDRGYFEKARTVAQRAIPGPVREAHLEAIERNARVRGLVTHAVEADEKPSQDPVSAPEGVSLPAQEGQRGEAVKDLWWRRLIALGSPPPPVRKEDEPKADYRQRGAEWMVKYEEWKEKRLASMSDEERRDDEQAASDAQEAESQRRWRIETGKEAA
jgi:hypothetical protein